MKDESVSDDQPEAAEDGGNPDPKGKPIRRNPQGKQFTQRGIEVQKGS